MIPISNGQNASMACKRWIVDARGYLVDQHEEKVGLIEGECNIKPHFSNVLL